MGELRDCDRDFLLFNPHWPPRGDYAEVIVSLSTNRRVVELNLSKQAVISVVVFLPGFVSPFLTSPKKDFVLFIDMIFSYLSDLHPRMLYFIQY